MVGDLVVVERRDGVGFVTLNRPERLNALVKPMWPLLTAAFDDLAGDGAVFCVVLAGAGAAFSPGADISEFAGERGNAEQAEAYGRLMDDTYRAIRACPKPLLAGIRGPCTGAGLVLALLCDLRIAAENSRFGAPVARLGLAMPYPELAALVAVLGPARSLELLLEARLLDAAEAAEIGLITRVVAESDLDREVRETAARIAAGAPLVHRWHKQFAARLATGKPLSPEEISASYASFGTEDYREGYQAFMEKRKPVFRGR